MEKTTSELSLTKDQAWEVVNKLNEALHNQAKLFLIVGQLLKEIRDKQLFKLIGEGGSDDFIQFVNSIGMSQPTAYLYIRIFEYYIEKLGMDEGEIIKIPLNRLMRLLPNLKKLSDEDAKAMVQKVGPLTHTDYSIEVKENHLETERPILRTHKECGKYIFEFREDQMCNCEGGSGIIDLKLLD